jgi:DNA-binding XRE family transcriptional regulator
MRLKKKEPELYKWEDVREDLMSPETQEGYEKARHAFELGEKVREMREKAGLTQTELAKRMASTQPSIARLEAGGVTPSIDILTRVAQAFDVELSIGFKEKKAS